MGTNKYEIKVAIAAPLMPQLFMRNKFNIIFSIALESVKTKLIKVRFSETKYCPKATPQNTPKPAQICIWSAPAACK